MASIDTIQGGSFQDAGGNLLALGSITFQLSAPAQTINDGQAVPNIPVTFALNSSGSVPSGTQLYGNDQLTPSGTFYIVRIYNALGVLARGPENWILSGSSPIDLGGIVPATPANPLYAPLELVLSGNTAGTLSTLSSGSVILAGGTNITLSQNGQSVTINAGGGTGGGSVLTSITSAAGGATSGTVNTASSSAFGLVAGSNVTLSQNSTSPNITVSVNVPTVLSSLQISSGNTAGATSNITSGGFTLVGGNNITLSQSLQVVTVVGPTVPTATNFVLNGTSSSVSISAGAGIGIGNNASTITISASVQTSSISMTALGNTTVSSSGTFSNLLNISGAGLLSVGAGAGSMTLSVTAPPVGLSSLQISSGNTAGASTNITSGGVSLVGGANITLSQSLQVITIVGAAGGAAGTQSFSGGGTSVTGTAISIDLVGGNNISVASASGAGSLTLTFNASSNALNNVSLLNASSGAMSVSAGAGIGIGNAASTITISASVQTSSVSLTILGNTTVSSTGTFSNLLNISGAGIISVGAGAGSITISAPTPAVQTSSVSMTGLGNTTVSSAGTFSNLLNVSGAGIISVGMGAGSLTISATTPSVTNFSTVSLTVLGNTTSSSAGTFNNLLNISGAGIASVGAGAGSITISVPAPPTATNFALNGTSSSVSLVAGSNIALTTGASSITINVTGPKISLTQNDPLQMVGIPVVSASTIALGNTILGSSLFLDRVFIPGVMNLSEVDMAMSLSMLTISSGSASMNRSMVVYSFVNSTSLASVLSTTQGISFTGSNTTTGASTALSQVLGGWTQPGGVIVPMTFASSSLAPGDYVIGNIVAFSYATNNCSLSLFGVAAPGIALASIAGGASNGLLAGSVLTSSASVSVFGTSGTAGFSVQSSTTLATTADSIALTAWSVAPTKVAALSSGGLSAGSFISVSSSIAAITNNTTLPAFNYLGASSVLTGGLFYSPFQNGVMSTGGIPANITLTTGTTAALTTYGSTAAAQPWFALVGL